MYELTMDVIRHRIADSERIFQNGQKLFLNGLFHCFDANMQSGTFVYEIDGNYGDYTTRIQLNVNGIQTSCDCPYPGKGCKHTVGALLDVMKRMQTRRNIQAEKDVAATASAREDCLSEAEIRDQAIADRHQRAKKEEFRVIWGDMLKGEHVVETAKGKQYVVAMHDPLSGKGHCSCPDFISNRLGTCKHLIHLHEALKKGKAVTDRAAQERFPYVDIYWDSVSDKPRLFSEKTENELAEIQPILGACFRSDGVFVGTDLGAMVPLIERLSGNKIVRIQESVLQQVDRHLQLRELERMSKDDSLDMSFLKTRLYPYQHAGVRFALYRPAALIGDQMGLGKTLQAIAAAILKSRIFGFSKILIITLASLKEQWKREIERFTNEKAVVVAGSVSNRRRIYMEDAAPFKITNYESVLRDLDVIRRFEPDLVILDEAQRIKNFATKTAEAIKMLPRRHSLVLTGTPLENRLEDIYSIVQFLDPPLLSPLWQFAADHYLLSRTKKGKILGYRNLDKLNEKLKALVIRRKREEVLDDLPEEVVNTYFVDLDIRQRQMHASFSQKLVPLIHKKFLTPMDIRRMQELLLCMRRACDSTYLIDRSTQISPKLQELQSILEELVLANGRKVVIFSEWTTMTFLIGKLLSDMGIDFVELTGKVPVPKRQALIDAFTSRPECRAFLSTDAGGTGLNLQAADCIINFDIPWNPAKLNQRIGRVSRIGQKSSHIHVVNLVARNSIEERILAGIQLKTDVFTGVFDGGIDTVEFSQEKRLALLGQLREMIEDKPEMIAPEPDMQPDVGNDMSHVQDAVLRQQTESVVNYDAEETAAEPVVAEQPEEAKATPAGAHPILSQPPEKVEAVLNAGMQFIGGLLEMATGQPIAAAGGAVPMVHVDRERGEITLKFKLPGF
ncbi:SNF2-related protein [Desulfatirhabdium butyrativorans]|uniref:DEAD/DEAH box helicase n=1 Tax=Desulfatirhabdium butyrativorans TaxID=340467 RepID=UPI000417C67A|nr:SNF2-related protein [Desulfatirhabdium butyrativorans]